MPVGEVVVVGFKINCPSIDLSYRWNDLCGDFYNGILARIYASFEENHGKLRMPRSISVTGVLTWHLPSSSFERYHSATGVSVLREVFLSPY